MTLVVAARTLVCIKTRSALNWFAYNEAVSERLASLNARLVDESQLAGSRRHT